MLKGNQISIFNESIPIFKILSSQVVSVMNSLNSIQISESVRDGPLCPDQILVLLPNQPLREYRPGILSAKCSDDVVMRLGPSVSFSYQWCSTNSKTNAKTLVQVFLPLETKVISVILVYRYCKISPFYIDFAHVIPFLQEILQCIVVGEDLDWIEKQNLI